MDEQQLLSAELGRVRVETKEQPNVLIKTKQDSIALTRCPKCIIVVILGQLSAHLSERFPVLRTI
jgi:hypothetical protein